MTTRKKFRVVRGGHASEAELLKDMKTYQLRMLLARHLPDWQERLVREELARRKAPANDPGKKHRQTSRVFRSKMEAIEFANEVLGPDYRVVKKMPGLLLLERKDNGAEFLLAWDGEERGSRDPANDPSRKKKGATRLRRLPGPKPTVTFAVFHPVTSEKKVFKGNANKDKAHRQAVRWAKQYHKSVRLTLLSSNAFGARPFKVTAKGKWLSNQTVKNPKAPRRTKYVSNERGGWKLATKPKKRTAAKPKKKTSRDYEGGWVIANDSNHGYLGDITSKGPSWESGRYGAWLFRSEEAAQRVIAKHRLVHCRASWVTFNSPHYGRSFAKTGRRL